MLFRSCPSKVLRARVGRSVCRARFSVCIQCTQRISSQNFATSSHKSIPLVELNSSQPDGPIADDLSSFLLASETGFTQHRRTFPLVSASAHRQNNIQKITIHDLLPAFHLQAKVDHPHTSLDSHHGRPRCRLMSAYLNCPMRL